MTTALLYLSFWSLILVVWVIGFSMGRDDAPVRVQVERDRCAQLCCLVPHAGHPAERMAAEHHAGRIRAAILRTVPPAPVRQPAAR